MPIRLLQSSEALIRWHSSLGDSLLWPRNTPIPKKPAVNTTNQGDDAGDIFQSHNPAPKPLAPSAYRQQARPRPPAAPPPPLSNPFFWVSKRAGAPFWFPPGAGGIKTSPPFFSPPP